MDHSGSKLKGLTLPCIDATLVSRSVFVSIYASSISGMGVDFSVDGLEKYRHPLHISSKKRNTRRKANIVGLRIFICSQREEGKKRSLLAGVSSHEN